MAMVFTMKELYASLRGLRFFYVFEVKASHFLEAEALNTSHYQHIQMLSWFHYC